MSGYEPGTVATLRIKDASFENKDRRALRGLAGWLVPGGGMHQWGDNEVTDVRPLVVLDNEFDRTIVKHLRTAFAQNPALTTLDWLAHQIEAQTRPPKPATVSVHDSACCAGWTDVDGVRYCNSCGYAEGARRMEQP